MTDLSNTAVADELRERTRQVNVARRIERRRAFRDLFWSRGNEGDEARRQAEYDIDVRLGPSGPTVRRTA